MQSFPGSNGVASSGNSVQDTPKSQRGGSGSLQSVDTGTVADSVLQNGSSLLNPLPYLDTNFEEDTQQQQLFNNYNGSYSTHGYNNYGQHQQVETFQGNCTITSPLQGNGNFDNLHHTSQTAVGPTSLFGASASSVHSLPTYTQLQSPPGLRNCQDVPILTRRLSLPHISDHYSNNAHQTEVCSPTGVISTTHELPLFMTGSQFDILLRKLNSIALQNDDIKSMLAKVLLYTNQQITVTDDDLPKLPLDSYSDVDDIEVWLAQDPEKKKTLVAFLALTGSKSTTEDEVRRVMSILMTNRLSEMYNWAGRGPKNKRPFQKLALANAVLCAVRKNRPTAQQSIVDDAIKNWLKGSGSRDSKREERREERRKKNQPADDSSGPQ